MEEKLNVIYTTKIQPEWLDYNGHMNVAYYVLVFDKAEEQLFESLGLGETVANSTGMSWMVLENHITYDDEVVEGQEVVVQIRLVDHDHKRMHLYLEMHAGGEDGYLTSTLEQMVICADLKERKSAEFPAEVMANIERLSQQFPAAPADGALGRTIGIRRK